jgi:hypothetical protein
MRILVFLMFFFLTGALFIISNNNLAMYQQENIVSFVDLYLTWLNNLTSNLYSITGNVVGLDWIPE